MSHRYVAYYPLALALCFGLAISFIPASSVLGSNITACQGSGNPSAKLTLGGRTITPTLILQAATGTTCPTGETNLGLVSLSRTIIVSPVITPTTNGTALLTTMTFIAGASPSASNPWLLKLEPGQYDLGNQSLTMLPYVDLEGSGEDTTLLSSTVGSVGTLVAASNSEVRFVTVANAGSTNSQAAVSIPGNTISARFFHLTASTTSSSGLNSYGLYNGNGASTVTVQYSTLSASGGTNNNIGLYNGDGMLTVQNSILSASGGTNTTSLANIGGASMAMVTNSNLTATGSGTAFSYGLFNSYTVTVQNSTLTASGGGTANDGLKNSGGTATVQNSTLSATGSGGSASYGFLNGGTGRAGASQLVGSSAASNGLTKCPASYDGNFNPLNQTTCV